MSNKTIHDYSDLLIALVAVGIMVLMVVPLPTILLDFFLTISITSGIVILLVTMYLKSPSDFTTFPTILLLVTLFRLSLNVASTRLILLHGQIGPLAAGKVIMSFGQFVVGGNYIVGAIIFIILVLINFLVITKGAVRASEVAARFTLDSIPGKQMSIDADLNAGVINDQEARERRRKLEEEANFYGSMDGAIRFVRGDAIAGIIITLINIIGGGLMGVIRYRMPIGEAFQVYTLLTIGDGLVGQIPALIVSTAAGIVVTRAIVEDNLGSEVTKQFFLYPRVFYISAGALLFFAIIPGLPHLAFIILGLMSAWLGYVISKEKKEKETMEVEKAAAEASSALPEKVESLLPLDVLELDVGYELIPLVDTSQKGDLLDRIKSLRRQFAVDMGMIVPPLHIRDNLQLKSNNYSLLIKGVEVAKGNVMMGHYLAMDPGTGVRDIKGVKTREAAFGLPAIWVTESAKDEASAAGYTVVDVTTVITTHLKEIIKKYSHEILSRQDVQSLIDNFKENSPKVVEELIPNLLSLGGVQKVLQNLLKEGISIRDMQTILETLADFAPATKDTDLLTEYARQKLSRSITKQYLTSEGNLPVMIVDKAVEDMIEGAVQQSSLGSYLALDPGSAQRILEKIKTGIDNFTRMNHQPIILASPKVRMHLKKLTERFIPDLVILSHNEISPDAKVETLGVLNI